MILDSIRYRWKSQVYKGCDSRDLEMENYKYVKYLPGTEVKEIGKTIQMSLLCKYQLHMERLSKIEERKS